MDAVFSHSNVTSTQDHRWWKGEPVSEEREKIMQPSLFAYLITTLDRYGPLPECIENALVPLCGLDQKQITTHQIWLLITTAL